MDLEVRQIILGLALFVVALGLGIVAENIFDSQEKTELYQGSFNVTLDSDNRDSRVEFDNKTFNLTYESWEEFKAFIETSYGERELNTVSDNQVNRLEEVIVLDREAYRLYFEYKDDPNVSNGDYLRLYRIEQIQ